MKRFFAKKSTDWEKFIGIKTSSKQKTLAKEMQNQINENGFYAIFDKSNSKEKTIKRLNERKNESWKRAGIIIAGIGALIAIAGILMSYQVIKVN